MSQAQAGTTNILLTGIHSESGLESEVINFILELSDNLEDGKHHESGFDKSHCADERSLGPRGKVATVRLEATTGDDTTRPGSTDDNGLRVNFLFDGPAIWRDEWFSPEYFEILMASRPLDGICLIMNDWPPEGDYRLSRWLEWVSFYEEILAPIWENKIDIYVLFLYKAKKQHIEEISATATTYGIRCFVVGDAEHEYVSGVSEIDAEALARWVMALVVDVNVLEEPATSATSKGDGKGDPVNQGSGMETGRKEEPVLADLDEDDPLAGVDLSGFKVEYEDEDEPKPFTTIDDEGDPLAGVNLEGFKLEYEDDEDEIEPPDTAGEGSNERKQDTAADEILVRDAPKKPLRLGQCHQFLRSVVLDLKTAFEREIEKIDAILTQIQTSLHELGEQLVSLYTNLGSFEERHGELSGSTKLVCGRVITRNHHMKLLDPCPRTFRFDEVVNFPIQSVRELEISGRKDPKVWGVDPTNPKRFVGAVKNDIYRSAKCQFELMGYEKDVRANTIKELATTIRELLENIETCKNQKAVLSQEHDVATDKASEINAQLALCNLDLDTLQDPASLDWDMANMRYYLGEHSFYGIAKEYGLCSVAKMSFHSFNQDDLKNFKSLLKKLEAASKLFSSGLEILQPSLQQSQAKAEEVMTDLGNLTSDLDVKPQHTHSSIIKSIDQDLARLEQRKRLWRPHFSELGSLATEAKAVIASLGSERMAAIEATSALQNKVKAKASSTQLGEPTEALTSILSETQSDLRIYNDVKDILEGEFLDVGIYATMKYQPTTMDGLIAFHDGVIAQRALTPKAAGS
ncbi:hypothetical protein TWF696_000322 [Orbilia brochopaga]|uniref:Uncharacterized protein n=1 Tax=Orbilia brochopaga TaxID=3140254 RepID=A0AAV9VBC6_9PEZI